MSAPSNSPNCDKICDYLCCAQEKDLFIHNPRQAAGYQRATHEISINIWYLRIFIAIICWSSTIYSIIHAILCWRESPDGILFFYWFLYYTHWCMICQNVYWFIVIYLHYVTCKQCESSETNWRSLVNDCVYDHFVCSWFC